VAARHAFAHEGLLAFQPQVHGRGAGGDDQRIAGIGAGVADQGKRLLGQLGGVDLVEDDLGLEALGVALEAVHQLGALHAVDVGRPVVDISGRHQLAALLHAGDDDRREVGARGIHRSRIAGGAGTKNDEFVVCGAHVCNQPWEKGHYSNQSWRPHFHAGSPV